MKIPRNLSHAYIVTGGGEASRRRYAEALAAAYVCGNGPPACGRCRDCIKAESGNHPDITVITLEENREKKEKKKEITVEQARAVRGDAYIRPTEARRKVYLIDPADALNPAAQNVLLKVVEEGPAYAAFILTAGRVGALLETLRSRCETIVLSPEEEERDPSQWARAEKLAALMLRGDEWALAKYLTELENEKLKSAEVLDLYGMTEEALTPSLAREPEKAGRELERLQRFRGLRVFNIGAGHLLGALAAGGLGPPETRGNQG